MPIITMIWTCPEAEARYNQLQKIVSHLLSVPEPKGCLTATEAAIMSMPEERRKYVAAAMHRAAPFQDQMAELVSSHTTWVLPINRGIDG